MVLRPVFLQLTHERQDVLAEVLDLLVVVQEAEEQQVDAEALVGDDALRDLFRGADESRTEAVVVLDEVLEGGVLPHALAVGGGAPGLLDGRAEAVDSLGVGLGDDFAEGVAGLRLGVAGDEEAVEAEAGRGASGALGGGPDVLDLLGDAVEVLAVEKYQSETCPAIRRAAVELPPWKISGCGRSGEAIGLGFRVKSRMR